MSSIPNTNLFLFSPHATRHLVKTTERVNQTIAMAHSHVTARNNSVGRIAQKEKVSFRSIFPRWTLFSLALCIDIVALFTKNNYI